MNTKIFQLAFCFMFSATAMSDHLEPMHDLNTNRFIDLNANFVVLIDRQDRLYKLVLDVRNTYTNSISCESKIQLLVSDWDGRVSTEDFQFSNLTIFPAKAFHEGSTYILDLPKRYSGMVLDIGEKKLKLRCHGKHPHKFLPDAYCRENIKSHNKTCEMVKGFGEITYYPVIQRGVLMGTCKCA